MTQNEGNPWTKAGFGFLLPHYCYLKSNKITQTQTYSSMHINTNENTKNERDKKNNLKYD